MASKDSGVGPEWHRSQSVFVVLCKGLTKQWWYGFSGRGVPLAMGTDAGTVGAVEIWDNTVRRR